ncbi:aldolase [Mycolicibacterium conceptionense]|uniref:Aldolase n=1 Tax=Mycolicibacterium conceptionense TaxID=451644 RepID=A0A1A2VJ82_9MYCO|nr:MULTISPECIES: aldolase/citrate lyase family protein [Mycolicibacterium]MCW1823297.1 HpcH/HpaI aldolase/citrate lyase family protein [Mycolicibacterium senegalense]OBB07588.1 aldolase [Mycolicibacterium conceptionense]OBF01114.1 aldolase [Mycolicibacterium conceptionense]OBF21016.1 aldolase [Mycolicibacterium conceptionense]OBF36058.1 aldolase [Mycolicibacterium conceptionense]
MTRRLDDSVLADVDRRLSAADQRLAAHYPGDDGRRQPVHTVYVPGNRYSATLPADWGASALTAAKDAGGLDAVAALVDASNGTDCAPETLAALVEAKLATEPIEDLRIDFEDGYGTFDDTTEDADVARAIAALRVAIDAGASTPFVGTRFKCFEAGTRARGLRTLDMFVSGLVASGGLPDGLTLTLPKVTSVDQVEAMVAVASALERANGLPGGRIRFEVQVETPQAILGADGRAPVAQFIHAGQGRVSSLHYGTYDYSASLGIAAAYQSMEHPAADHAKNVMQLAVAGTGVHMSDGSTNILPVGDPDNIAMAWKLHARLVRRHLERGIYQGWDMHPAQLVTRYLATYAFYRGAFAPAATRLRNYVHQLDSTVMDEPATARALANVIHRGAVCGALTTEEIETATDLPTSTVRDIALGRTTRSNQ